MSSLNMEHAGTTPSATRILPTVLDRIGGTPLVRINKLSAEEGVSCEILAKCEFFNAGGSVKDRIARRMIEAAETEGRIQPGDTIIEPTSGNTGIGLALCGAVKGYNVVITLPEKMSNEKVNVLKSLGATVLRTPTEAASDAPDSHISLARRLNAETPRSVILDQYANPNNPLAHYDGTAEEIIAACGERLDMAVIGAGTGGTVSGVGKRLKEQYPHIKIVGVDPLGSLLANPTNLDDPHLNQPYLVEGIGYDFVPDVMQHKYVDYWVTTQDRESFRMARRMIRTEGLLCGGSSGSAMVAALQAARHFNLTAPEHRIVVILPDSVRNYMTKFLSADWMLVHSFLTAEEYIAENRLVGGKGQTVETLVDPRLLTLRMTIKSDETVASVWRRLQEDGCSASANDQFPVVDVDTGCILGNFEVARLFERVAVEGLIPVMSYALRRFVNREFVTVNLEQTSVAEAVALCATKVPVYVVDATGRARLDASGSVQSINPFRLFASLKGA